jgi:hypothetical protein
MAVVLPEWYFTDPAKKDKAWANTIITYLRQYMQYVVPLTQAEDGMKWLLGDYDMKFAQDMFLDPAKSGVRFIPMAVLEKIRNVLISEIEDNGIHIELNAIDPTANDQKKRDRELLANKKNIEALLSSLNASIGNPPYSLKNDKNEDGDKMFNGDVDSFDSMGLNSSSDEDLEYFFKAHYRLLVEILGEDAINYLMQFNEVHENLALWVDDVMSKKAIACRQYINQINGAPTAKYVAPETVQAIIGRRRDFKDSPAIGYTQVVTVQEFLQMVGDEFDYEKDLQDLWMATTFTNRQEYTGVYLNSAFCCGTSGQNCCSFTDFMQFKVQIGYTEWKSNDTRTYVGTNKNKHGNPNIARRQSGYNKPQSNYGYKIINNIDEITYKSVYLVMSASSQKLYQFGKLAYQLRGDMGGMEDEYSNFSISVYKEIGKTVTELTKDYIIIIVKAFKKLENSINRAQPPGMLYNFESLVKIAKNFFPDKNRQTTVQDVINMFEQSANKIYTIPEINGQPVGGGTQVNIPIDNGLSKSVIEFKNTVDWAFQMIYDQLGISPLRQAYSPAPRDVAKLQEQALAYSDKATGYMPRMIMKMLNNVAKRMLCNIQDIIKFKDKNKIPYDFLKRALGDKTVIDLEMLDDIPIHRFGIMIHSFNSFADQEEMKAFLIQAYQNKEISPEQYLLIKGIKNPKRAAWVLAYEKRRNERKLVEQQQMQQQNAMQMQAQAQQAQAQTEQMKGQMTLQNTNMQGEWAYKVKQLEVQGEVQKQQMKQDAKPQEIEVKKNATIQQDQAKADLEAQAPLV